jgi:hypothetical protein
MGKEVTRVGQYALKRTLGKGAFGWVKLGVQDKTGLKVAIKVRFAFAFLVGLDCDWDWIRSLATTFDVRRSTFDGSRAPVETTTTDGWMDEHA